MTRRWKNYYFGPFPISDRNVIVSALENRLGPFATDDMVQRIPTDKIGKVTIGIGEAQAPPAMDSVQVQILLDELVDDDFLEEKLLFGSKSTPSIGTPSAGTSRTCCLGLRLSIMVH